MSEMLDSYGVTVVALSKDDVATCAAHRQRDGINFTLLADPALAVIKRFGLLHEGGFEFRTFLLGSIKFPMGWPTGFKSMAIPTTLLLDEDHTVRWIDQADDYRVRGDVTRTEAALREVYGAPVRVNG